LLELICQQRYRVGGVPVDLTPYRNHGVANDAPGVPGPDPARDVIEFPNLDSGVAIGLGKLGAWAPLRALKIEIVARLDPRAGRSLTLVEGDGSFIFDVSETALTASVNGPSGTTMYLRSADADAPDGKLHAVPTNKWTTLGFYHDGFAKMQVSIDGKLVGETSNVTGGVPPVQAGGVAIGNRLAGGKPLLGMIDEVRIWRLDPNQMRREFLCRPYDAATARCWEAIFQAIRAWIARDPGQVKALLDLIDARLNSLVRGLFLLPAAEQAKMRAELQELTKLWCEGHIAGSRMRTALEHWLADLKRLGLDPTHDLPTAEIEALLAGLGADKLTLDCDPAVIGFLRQMHKAIEATGGKAS
jgi:hypothetical protein